MAYINVDHSKFEQAAKAIDTYVREARIKMRSSSNVVHDLAATWQGKDASEFQNQWNRLDDSDSTFSKMIKDLESYAKFLRYAAKKYKDAQSNAVNRANGLPRW